MTPEEQDAARPPNPDGWSGFAEVYELPASVEHALADDEAAADAPPGAGPADDDGETDEEPLAHVMLRLTAALDDERARRGRAADEARIAAADAARLKAELAAERTRVTKLERERDEVIHRAEELLTAVRERADQRLAAELDASRRHWSELLAEERRRVEVLDGERAALLKRLEDAWIAVDPDAARRRTRPLRPWMPPAEDDAEPAPADDRAAGADFDAGDEDDIPDGESPELSADIDRLRQRLRTRLRKPPDMPDVEDGVEDLREARLAREKDGRRRRR